MVVALAVATHISVLDWLEAGDEAIATALVILDEQRQAIEESRG